MFKKIKNILFQEITFSVEMDYLIIVCLVYLVVQKPNNIDGMKYIPEE